ncbi:hypothetical protein P154DRAFT_421214 [Amniculicola lignicola CBS 123094]|uniref:Uncharacterized protein n=1 Tax=Amniculicola lignicola CBS 123094 TaxID=1392246 RepID=A0A6A5X2B4_9PLEO|nr:hypothetical protein P154DRAFT_421214 [Amniculicola lignicola CBS 123094]
MNCSAVYPEILHKDTRGWVGQSEGRGTLDIILSCSITVFLCIWTSVCVNVPSPEPGVPAVLRDRWYMFCLGLLGPEFIVLLAAGQYCNAKASVRAFKAAKCSEWTMKHGFFADMGGVHLQVSTLESFPINSKQLLFLVNRGHTPYPDISKTTITDKNKRDGLAKFISTTQMFWFTVSTISRPIKRYAMTTLETTTLAYILCAFTALFFWRHKPMDFHGPIVIECQAALEEIVDHKGHNAADPYHFTPLDFVSRQEWIGNRLWVYYVNLLRKLRIIHVFQQTRPVRRISLFDFPPPDRFMLFFMLGLTSTYTGIFVAGWNFHFPSYSEKILWRTCSLGTTIIVLIGGLFELIIIFREYRPQREPFHSSVDPFIEIEAITPPIRAHLLPKPPETCLETMLQQARNVTPNRDPHYDVPIRSLLFTTPICAMYCIFRLFILVEDAISLRELPASAFAVIAWPTYLPHL